MRVQTFIFLLLLRCSFAHEATTNDFSTLLEALEDFNNQEDITDELERIENNEELTTTSEDLDDTEKDGTMPGVQRMLTSLDASVEDAQQDQQSISYEKVGCFKDNQVDPRPLPELLADLTGEVDWYDLSKVIRKCARLASEKGYTVFGLQSFGHCRSGKDAAETYNSDGDSAGCFDGLGGRGENLVFKIIPQYPQVTVSTIAATTSPPETTTSLPTTEPPTIPPECQNYVTFTSINRSANNDKPGSSCDDNLPRGWYRFAGPAGDRMPTTCVPLRHCGTHAPGWFSGSHPAVHEGAVRRDVCFHWRSCCSWRNSVLVRNCGAFYVYYLSPTLTCNLGYCGNGQVPTTPPVTSSVRTTEPETTTSAPTTKTVKEPTTTKASTTTERSTIPETTTPAPTTTATKESTTSLPTTEPPTIPPECQNYVTFTAINRSANNDKPGSSCDDNLPRDWYRFAGPAGDRMPTTCVPLRHCGTHAPGWFSGSHPAVHEGAVRRDVCFHWRSCCSWRNSVLVRNCGAFYVYYLSPTLTCNLGYCGNGQVPTTSPVTSSVTTLTEPETTTPTATTRTTKETTTPVPTTKTAKETTTPAPITGTTKAPSSRLPPTPPTASECVSYSYLDSADRSMNFKANSVQSGKCDDVLQQGWYRFRGDAGDQMPSSCVAVFHCGTHAPGWLSTSHPTVAQGAVRAQVCFHWDKRCCRWSMNIIVRNCSGFYVYKLNKTSKCRLRYCGNGAQAPTTYPASPSPSSSESRPAPTLPTSPSNPSECLNYKFLNESNRAQGYSSRNRLALCDDKLSESWYRFSGGAGDKMPDYCVEKLSCGTHAPGWLNTTHPSVADGIVETNVCFHWGSDCCYWSATMKVRNCGRFFVYQLSQTPYCNLRYCGNKDQEPSTSPKPTTHPSPSPTPECTRYRVLLNGDRSQSYEHKSIQGAKPKCDRRLPKAWYRFMGLAGDRMPETCVSSYHCGTHAPGWLRGAHPDASEGVVSRTVCFTWRNKCCSWRSTILVRNCGNFYVYKLQRAPKCKLRYCGVGVNALTTALTTAKQTTTKPPQPTPTNFKHGFIILCLPTEMQVHVARNSLPPFVDPSLLRLDDPRCGVVQADENDIRLATPLDRCGTTRRTYDESVSFHNKVMAESGIGSKRSVMEFPFRCSYKKLPSSEIENYLQPLYYHGQVMDSTLDDYKR